MVQWLFKALEIWQQLKQALAKPKAAYMPLIDFNMGFHMDFVRQAGPKLFHCRTEEGLNLVARVIDSERAVQLLTLPSLRTGDTQELARAQGRIEALTLLSGYLRDATDPAQHRERMKNERNAQEEKSKILKMRRSGASADPVM